MEFRILGDLEVRHDDTVVAVRGRQQPKILAMLLLEAGDVVPVDRLVDALWDDDPPATARRQVQNTVATLRRTLASADDGVIEQIGDGYRLSTDNLDDHEFGRHVRLALADIDRERLSSAHARLCRALELWRGRALAGMRGRLLAAAAARLEEARLHALETRMDVELRLGQPGRVAEEARRLLSEHPYRQNLAALLMRGLHQAGRVPEAFEVFARLRARLAADLGIDPARWLRDLHEELRRGGAEGATAEPAPAPPKLPAPAQLPADVSGFTGRDDQLAALDSMLGGGGTTVCTLSGPGGIGKTALAVHWGRSRSDSFPGGQLFADLRGYGHGEPVGTRDVLTRFLRAFGRSTESIPSDMDEAVALYRTILNSGSVLVVLDNASDVGQVRPLLPAGPGCLAIVTSRDRLVGLTVLDGARPVGLDHLDDAESLELLSGMVGGSRLDAEPEAARRVVDLCGRLPLALRVFGGNLAARPGQRLADVAAELAGADRLERLTVRGDSRATVADSINLSVSSLDATTRRFFLLLGLIPGAEISSGLAARMSGHDIDAALALLNRLTAAHLIEHPKPDRWRFHDLVRLFARSRAESDLDVAERDSAVNGLLDWSHDNQQDITHEDKVAAVVRLAGHPRVWKVARGLKMSIHDGHEPEDVRRIVELAVPSAVRHRDDTGLSILHNLIAGTHWAARRIPQAIEAGERAIEASRRTGDSILISRHLSNMANYLSSRGENPRAKALLEESLALSEDTGDVWAISSQLDDLGQLCIHLGEYEQAERHLRRSLDICPPDPEYRWPKTRVKLAQLYLDTGRYAEGLRFIEDVVTKGPNWYREAALRWRGWLHLAAGDRDAAYADMTGHVDWGRANRYVGGKAALLEPLTLCLSERGDQRAALIYARECLESGRSGGMLRDEAIGCLLLSIIHNRLADHDTALDFGRRARDHYEQMAQPLRLGRALVALATAHAGLGDLASADELRAEAVEIFTRLGVLDFETT